MPIKSEDWILLALKNASERNGLDLNKWYTFYRPDELELSFADFSKIVDEMEDNDLLRTHVLQYHTRIHSFHP